MVIHQGSARDGCRSGPQSTGDASLRRAHIRQGPRALRSVVPSLDLDTLVQDLPDPRQLKTSSSMILNRPFDGKFKPQAYAKHLCLTDKFRPTIPAMLSDRCREAVEERVRRLKQHEETHRRHPKAYNRLRLQESCSTYAEARQYVKDLFAETHIIRDEASLVPPAVDYSYSRIDAATVDGRRPAVYDYDDAQIRPRTAGYSPGHVRSMSPCPPPLCVDASTFPFFADAPPTHATTQGATQKQAAEGRGQQPRAHRQGLEDGPLQTPHPADARLRPRPSTSPDGVSSFPSTSSRASRAPASVASTRFDTTTRRQAYAALHTNTIRERQWRRVYSVEEKLERQKEAQLLKETMRSLNEFEKRHLQGFAGKQGLGVIYS